MSSLLLHFMAVLAFSVAGCTLTMPSKHHAYRLVESSVELSDSTVERSNISLRGTSASTPLSNSNHPISRELPAVYPKLLEPTSFPTSSSPASSDSPSSFATAFRKASQMIDDVFGFVEYRPVSLQVFLVDTSLLMDDRSRSTFELVALEFIVERIDRTELPIDSVGDVAVVDQRLTWTRVVEGKSSTGLEVSFEAGVVVSDDVEQYQLERAIQALFDASKAAKEFRSSFDLALRGPTADGPESTTEFSLEPMRVPLGLAATLAGFVGFLAIVVASVCHVSKKEGEEDKDLGKTSAVNESDDGVDGRPLGAYPVQQVSQPHPEATGQQYWDSSESDVLSYDDYSVNPSLNPDLNASLNASLTESDVFCPSVEKGQKETSAIFDCDQSAIAKDIDRSTESDNDETYKYSPVRQAAKRLTDEDLRDFDDELRRADC